MERLVRSLSKGSLASSCATITGVGLAAFCGVGCCSPEMAGACTSVTMRQMQETREANQVEAERKANTRQAMAVRLKTGTDAKRACGSVALIDDAEDGNAQLYPSQGRDGNWFTLGLSQQLKVEPPKNGPFVMTMGGHQSRYASRVRCLTRTGRDGRCGIGFDFRAEGKPFDASAYGGISFWARRGPNANASVTLHVQDAQTDRRSELCSTCGQHRGTTIQLTDRWTLYEIAFSELRTKEGATSATLPLIRGLYTVTWDIALSKGDYELWIDDVRFIGCTQPAAVPPAPATTVSPAVSPTAPPGMQGAPTSVPPSTSVPVVPGPKLEPAPVPPASATPTQAPPGTAPSTGVPVAPESANSNPGDLGAGANAGSAAPGSAQ
jgi:hypothetical protein